MPTRLLLPLLALHAALDLIAAESLPVHNSSPVKLNCSGDKGLLQDVCCDKCPAGSVVDRRCTETSRIGCKNCTKGAEYMDHPNLLDKCRRCRSCDTQHGLEIEENCTIYQDTKCRCRPGFFCRSEPCSSHCDPCDKCKGSSIEEECTPTKNTKCSKGNLLWLWILIAIVSVAILAVPAVVIWRSRRKKSYGVPQHAEDEEHIEMVVQHFPDIDLSPHIANIAADMKKEHVLKFVRKLGIEPGVIDDLTNDHSNNTGELKIALLQKWYEQNGMRGAHETLIFTLRDLKLRSIADKIEQKITLDIS